MKKNITKRIATLDDKSLIEEQHTIELPINYTNKMTLMLHMEMVTGKHNKKDFRLIMDANYRAFRLEYNNRHIDFTTRELVNTLMDKMIELNNPKRKRGDIR